MVEGGRLLIVEDEPAVRALLVEYFTQAGFEVEEAESAGACRNAQRRRPDLVLLDVNLPDADGFALARELRESTDAGIIFVTNRDGESDRVVGLELGGDDYVTKPINLRELLARVRSVLRRRRETAFAVMPGDIRRFAGWTVNLARRDLAGPGDRSVRLTRGEFDLLAALVRASGRPLDRAILLELIANRQAETSDRSIDMLISRLRRKIETNPKAPEIIVTVPGVGYRLGVPVE